jgi:DNA-binding Xre family transcriptional regulator
MAVRHRIREVAESKGFSRTKLSRRAEINYKTVNELWNDEYRVIDTRVLDRIAKALKVPIGDLIVQEPDKEEEV